MPSGATLNLNNLHLYVRGDQISGTIVGGTVTRGALGRLDRSEYPDARDAVTRPVRSRIGRSTAPPANRSRSSSTPAAAARTRLSRPY